MTTGAEPAAESVVASSSTAESKPLSKNAQKKLAKAAWMAEQKKERRAHEKERRKEKKRELAAKRAAGEIDESEDAERRKRARTDSGPKEPFHARIIVDLGFDDMMTENEVKSLTSQLAYTYSANRKTSQPFASLLFTGLNGRTFTRLEGMSNAAYKRWHDTEWWPEGYEKLWHTSEGQLDGSSSSQAGETKDNADPGLDATDTERSKPSEETSGQVAETALTDGQTEESGASMLQTNPQRAPRESVVYLTADSSDELTELKEGETYIIGGICDHNRYKNLCFKKSQASGIRSARLPIGTYLAELRTRKVLTVNQTFEILLKWVETRDWRAAFEEVVPKRKFRDPEEGNKGRKKLSQTPDDEGEDDTVMTVDAVALEDEDQAASDEVEGNVPVASSNDFTVAAPPEADTAQDIEPATVPTDDTQPKVPSQSTS